MEFSVVLAYFLVITTWLLLSYHFLVILLFSFKDKAFMKYKSIQRVQQFLLILLFIGMMVYQNMAMHIKTLSVIPWIWGFLAGHVYITQKKRWLHELLGFGLLIAITIILFFKQTEIIQFITQQDITNIITEIHLVYVVAGFVLGMLLWARTSSS